MDTGEEHSVLKSLIADRTEDILGRQFLRDKGKMVDYVLVYQPSKLNENQNKYREAFEKKLREQGLILNTQMPEESSDGVSAFVKIRAPQKLLQKVAKINHLQVPIQESDIVKEKGRPQEILEAIGTKFRQLICCKKDHPFILRPEICPPAKPMYFTAEFDPTRFSEFKVQEGEENLFTELQKIQIVHAILQRVTIGAIDVGERRLAMHLDKDVLGIHLLLEHRIYTGVFPLHDSDMEFTAYYPQPKRGQMRHWLAEFWARPGRWNKYQPLDEIRGYFGEKVAMYFAWLGFYTSTLAPLALIGVLCFSYGFGNFYGDESMRDVCFRVPFIETMICRACKHDEACQFNRIDEYCSYTIVNAIIENYSTIPWALALCIWSVCLLEFMKRYEARLACKWGTLEFHKEYEPPRSEYQLMATKRERHPITHEMEPYISSTRRFVSLVRSLCAVAFFICVVLAVILGLIVYRAMMVLVYFNMDSSFVKKIGASTFTTITASLMSAVAMIFLEKMYGRVAYFLTEKEFPRTSTDFENSYTFKMFVFQFVNYYTALFYLAFFQSLSLETLNHPHKLSAFSDYCSPVGCTFSVTTQLCTVLVVKQMLFNVVEIGIPAVKSWFIRRKKTFETAQSRHEKDYHLPDYAHLGLLKEYLEIVLQYGFVVMFGAVFPLAPLFALANNILEIRVDAFKLISCKRVLPHRARDIGNWYKVMEFLTKLAVLTNAFLIAFTTNILDRWAYMWKFSEGDSKGTLKGFISFTLSKFNTSEWNDTELSYSLHYNKSITECWYKGYYHEPGSEFEFQRTREGWTIFFIKLGFVLAFQNVVLWVHSLVKFLVSDVPKDVQLHILRDHYVAREWQEAGSESRLVTARLSSNLNDASVCGARKRSVFTADMMNNRDSVVSQYYDCFD